MNTEQKCDKCLAHNITIDHECPPLMRALKENHDSKNPPCDEPGCTVCNSLRHHTEQKGSRNIDFVAMNIVYQIGDALYDALPPNIAREHFVEARQSTNDVAIDFAAKLIERTLQEEREEMARLLELGGEYIDLEGEFRPAARTKLMAALIKDTPQLKAKE